ncbi:acetate/propionate family kinase [Myxosarcina sp. GI1]|uniref:acetate/propionate family kinase n=1 Tax=Myxosarcina sp. GI1 TaxID=1541065 RepID=UPI00055FA289|nr:acetate kinase [Myxosarcina sp. GI1]
MKILVLNPGSSTQKSCLYQLQDELPTTPPKPMWEGKIDWSGDDSGGKLEIETDRTNKEIELESRDELEAIAQMLDTLTQGDTKVINTLTEIDVVGHRVVHGGADYSQATRITPEVKEAIAQLIPLAPEHNPAHLKGIEAIEAKLGDIPQVAVFDTAFHSQMPLKAKVYPLPYKFYERGIRRYGFHGTSHRYCGHRAAQILNKPLEELKIITCHLGNGCSLAAIANGVSIDTTMGFTPLEGLMMGTRSGSIDPAILIYLMQKEDYDRDRLNTLLNKESGLKGVSGISNDLRQIFKAIDENNERAELAVDVYIHYLRKGIAAMAASLQGLDVLVFTAGVGEHQVLIREKACHGFEYMGLKLNKAKNKEEIMEEDMAACDSKVRILTIPTNEDWAIASECWQLFQQKRS